jgi:tetratricopeptide (TPR) repeat protein
LRRIIDEEPSIFDHRLKLARFYDKHQAVDRAEAVLREAVRIPQEKEQPWLALTDFLKQRRGQMVAERAYLEAARELPYSSKIRFGLAALYEENNDEAKARSVYESLIKEYDEKPAGLDAHVKVAALDFAAGRHEQAEDRLADVLKQNPRAAEGLILQGKIALARRRGKDAVQAFRTVLRDQPELAHVQVLLGQAHLMSGESQLARESFERAVALYPKQVDATLALAMLERQAGHVQRARARVEEIVNANPDHLRALETLFSFDLAARDWVQAKKTYAKLRAALGQNPSAFMAEGRLYEAHRQFGRAIAAFEQAMAVDPSAPEPLLAVVKLEIGLKQIDRARARLEALLAARPDHPYGHGLLGEVMAFTGRQDEAETRFRMATGVNPKWITPWLNWATLKVSQRKPEAAIRILTEGLSVNADSEELHMMLAAVLSDHGEVDAAIAEYGMVLRMNPQNIFSANNLAVLLVDYKGDVPSLEKAFVLSRDFEREAPHPLFLDTLGWVRLKMGHLDHALRVMKDAVVKAPDLQALNYHFGMALYQSGNKEEARLYLSNALKKPDSFIGRQAAEQLLAQTSG